MYCKCSEATSQHFLASIPPPRAQCGCDWAKVRSGGGRALRGQNTRKPRDRRFEDNKC